MIKPYCFPNGMTCDAGLWLRTDVARHVFKQADRTAEADFRREFLEEKDRLQRKQITHLKVLAESQQATAIDLRTRLRVLFERHNAEATEAAKWYRNQWLWFSVGIVLGGGTVAFVAAQ